MEFTDPTHLGESVAEKIGMLATLHADVGSKP